MGARVPSVAARCGAEVVGTFLLVFFGCGSVHTAVLIGAQSGLWQVAVVWGVAIMMAAFTVGGISGAHLNPAVTLALAAWGRFPRGHVLPYVLGQLAGAFLAAAVLFGLFHPFLAAKERDKQVVRGQPGSEITACCYGEYFPNPGGLASGAQPYSAANHDQLRALVCEPTACLAEVLGTLILALVIFAVTDPHNEAAPQSRLAPVFIGLTVSILISVIAPLTQACFNPARDFGPRLFAYFAGWGSVALPGPGGTGFLTVYIISPIVGALAGGGLYCRVLRPTQAEVPPEGTEGT
jgi:glycerol uptake facilitator protein